MPILFGRRLAYLAAETAQLLKPIAATELTERLLVGAFLAIDGAKRMDDRRGVPL
jgi:hypothetical protein